MVFSPMATLLLSELKPLVLDVKSGGFSEPSVSPLTTDGLAMLSVSTLLVSPSLQLVMAWPD